MLGVLIWSIALYNGALLRRFWPRGAYIIAAISIGITVLGVAMTLGNPILDHQQIFSAAGLGRRLAINVALTAFFVSLGYGIGQIYRRRRARVSEKTGE